MNRPRRCPRTRTRRDAFVGRRRAAARGAGGASSTRRWRRARPGRSAPACEPGPRSPIRTGCASSATSTGSSTRARGGGSRASARCSSPPKTITSAPGSRTRSRSRRSPPASPAPPNLCVPLAEAIALAHDCGHGPAGHASEEAFSPYLPGGYDHAVYGADVTLAPLNLCVETLDGVRNHSWRRPAAVHARGRGRRVGRPHRVRLPRLRGRGARRDPRARRPPAEVARRRRHAAGREQIGAFVLAVLDAIDRTGHVGMTEPAATALAAFRAFNFERIYLRPAARRQAEKVDPPAARPRRPLRRRAARACPCRRHGYARRPRAGLARGGRGRRALRERHDRPLRARARRRAPRLAPRRPAARRLSRAATASARAIACARWASSTRTWRGSGRPPTSSRSSASTSRSKRVGRSVHRPVPVPHREDAVVLGQPREGRVLLLRLPEERRRDHVRARGRAPRLRRGGRAARGARRHHAALRRRVVLRGTASASSGSHEAVASRDRRSTTSCCSSRPTAGTARALPAQPRLRRRRGAPVQARLVARRLRRAERAPAAEEVRARRHRRRRARVREQGEQAAGLVPRPR